MKSLIRTVLRNDTAVVMLGQLIQLVLTFGTSLVIARVLSADGYGLMNLSRSVFALVALVASLGLDAALLKFCGRQDPNDALVRATVTRLRLGAAGVGLTVTLLAALGAAEGVFSRLFAHPGFDGIMLVTLAALPFAGDTGILNAVYRTRNEAGRFALLTYFLQSAVRVVLVAAAVLVWPTVMAIVAVNTLQIIVQALCLFADDRLRHGRRAPSGVRPTRAAVTAEARVVMGEALGMCLSLFVFGVMRLADILFLGAYADVRAVGEYSALATLSQLIFFYSIAGSQSLGPRVSRFFHEGDREALKAELRGYVHRAAIVSGFMFAGLAVYGDRLDLLFGKSFHFDPLVCFLLPLSALLSATLAPMGYALSMTGHHWQENAILTGGAALLVVALALLVPRYGQVGAASSVVIVFGTVNVVRVAYMARLHGFAPGRLRDLLPPVAGLVLAGLARLAGDAVGGRDLLTTAGACVLFTLAYAALYWRIFPGAAAPGRLRTA